MSSERTCAHCNKPALERSVTSCDRCSKLLYEQTGGHMTVHCESVGIDVDPHGRGPYARQHVIWCMECATEAGFEVGA